MLFLAIETATSRPSMAIFRDQKLLGSIECDSSGSLTPQIIPTIHQLLEDVSCRIKDLEGLAVSIGPGTFTGLRVGLATMTAFRLALGVPLVGVSTLEGLAWNLPNSDVPIISTVSIRTDRIYWARFRWQQGHLVREDDEQMGKFSDVCAAISEPTVFLGDGWIRNKECVEVSGPSIMEGPPEALWPSAKGIGQAGLAFLQRGECLPEGCSPHYIQASYAETAKSTIQA